MSLSKYNKFWMSLIAPIGVLVLVCAPLDKEAAFVVTRSEWYTVVVALASSLGVYQVKNSGEK